MLFRKKIKISKEDILNSIPLKNEALEYHANERGEMSVIITRKLSWWLKIVSKLVYLQDKKTVTLDELGTDVLNMCDGNITVKAMIERFSKKHKLNIREAEISMMAYLRSLIQRGIIAFAVKKEGSKNG